MIAADWQRELIDDPVDAKRRELAALDALEQEATTKFEATGLYTWWLARLKAMERRAKLLGLDAPTKQAITNPDGTRAGAMDFTLTYDRAGGEDAVETLRKIIMNRQERKRELDAQGINGSGLRSCLFIMIRLQPEAAARIHEMADADHRDFRRQIEHIIHAAVEAKANTQDREPVAAGAER